MGLFDRLFGRYRKSGQSQPDQASSMNMGLRDLKTGALLDYDLQTWEVSGVYHYQWENNFTTKEYKLESGKEVIFLHLEEDDKLECSIARKVPLNEIDPRLRRHIEKHDEPFEEIEYQGKTYYRTEENLGHFSEEGKSGSSKLVSWDFEDESEEYFVNIERWGESDFEAAAGVYADVYEFSNFLPPSGH